MGNNYDDLKIVQLTYQGETYKGINISSNLVKTLLMTYVYN